MLILVTLVGRLPVKFQACVPANARDGIMVIWLFQACVPANLSFHREQVALTKRVSMLGRRRTLPARVMHILHVLCIYLQHILTHLQGTRTPSRRWSHRSQQRIANQTKTN